MHRLAAWTALTALTVMSAGSLALGVVTIQVDDFDGPYIDIAQGYADQGIDYANNHKWRSGGFGPPTYFESNIGNTPPGVPNQGIDNQNYVLLPGPGSPYEQTPTPFYYGTGVLGNQKYWFNTSKNKWEWAWNKIDWVAFVQARGGPAPDLAKPAVFTADCQIAVGDMSHFDQLEITFDTGFDGSATKSVTRFSAKNSLGELNPAFVNATWFNDVALVSYTAFPTVVSAPVFLFDWAFGDVPVGVPASGVKFLIDDLKITYTPVCSSPPQDVDRDGDVDLADFGVFQACFNGPNRPWPDRSDADVCRCLDADPVGGDGDVDLADFGMFQTCFNGPNRPPAPGC